MVHRIGGKMAHSDFGQEIDKSLLHVHFVGPALETESVPIVELSTVLIALQGIINKAHLFRTDRLTKRANLSRREREEIALQLAFRRHGSDDYWLTAFFTDPVVVAHIKELIVDGLVALGFYTYRKIWH